MNDNAIEKLRIAMDHAQDAMRYNLNQTLYGGDWKVTPKPKKPLAIRIKASLGSLLLRGANALGEYNNYE